MMLGIVSATPYQKCSTNINPEKKHCVVHMHRAVRLK